jgi:hypothetical protein
MIRGDGLYKQIIHLDVPLFEYESDWLPWRIEYSDIGTPYLFLDGYRLYAFNPEFIDSETVGGGDGKWFDFCRRTRERMPPGEGMLIVSGVPIRFNQPPRGIELSFPSYSPENSPWTYTLQEQ